MNVCASKHLLNQSTFTISYRSRFIRFVTLMTTLSASTQNVVDPINTCTVYMYLGINVMNQINAFWPTSN